uniref:Uncharacterized protein n=1 Tax=Orbilia brochopaga TaxID=3140254 RepID=A0A481ZLL2_9PEZI|nr:hypothetical protein [Drechslerella brochopaga]QBL02544.1 hypothetical protein [Drechslerella brochopaga]
MKDGIIIQDNKDLNMNLILYENKFSLIKVEDSQPILILSKKRDLNKSFVSVREAAKFYNVNESSLRQIYLNKDRLFKKKYYIVRDIGNKKRLLTSSINKKYILGNNLANNFIMVNDDYMLYYNIIENEIHDFLKNDNNIFKYIILY